MILFQGLLMDNTIVKVPNDSLLSNFYKKRSFWKLTCLNQYAALQKDSLLNF